MLLRVSTLGKHVFNTIILMRYWDVPVGSFVLPINRLNGKHLSRQAVHSKLECVQRQISNNLDIDLENYSIGFTKLPTTRRDACLSNRQKTELVMSFIMSKKWCVNKQIIKLKLFPTALQATHFVIVRLG